MRSPVAVLGLFAAILPLAACTVGGARSASAENDRLRRRVMDLEKQVGTLEGEKRELSAKLTEKARLDATLPPEVLLALPRCTGVEVHRLSGFLPADPAQPATAISVAFVPTDGRGRFVQIAGTVRVEALAAPGWIKDGSAGEPTRLGMVILNPEQLRDAYRSGFTGTYYETQIPLASPVDRAGERPPVLMLRLELADAVTGAVHTAERIVSPGK